MRWLHGAGYGAAAVLAVNGADRAADTPLGLLWATVDAGAGAVMAAAVVILVELDRDRARSAAAVEAAAEHG